MNIAEQLVRGSHNIDRMKSEVREVVSILAGLIGQIQMGTTEKDDKLEFVFDKKYKWQICQYNWKVTGNYKALIDCYVQINGGFERVFSSDDRYKMHFSSKTTQDVWNTLPFFVEWVFEKYPDVATKCQPLIRAADRF